MRVRATGSPGVTTVNAVQTTVKGGRGEGLGEDQMKEKFGGDRRGKGNQAHPKAMDKRRKDKKEIKEIIGRE